MIERRELRLTLDVPITQNHAFTSMRGRGGQYLNQRARDWMSAAEFAISVAMKQQHWETITDEKVVVKILHFWPDRKQRDTHNSYKLLCDSMENAKVFNNDKYVVVRQQDYYVDKTHPRIEVVVYRLADESPVERCSSCIYCRGFEGNDSVSCIHGAYVAREKKVPNSCDKYKGGM